MNAAVAAALAAGATLQEKLQKVAQTILDMQHSDFGRLSSDMHLHVSEEGRAEVFARCGVPWAQISDVLRDAAVQGDVRAIDPDLASRGFFGMIISQRWQRISASARRPIRRRRWRSPWRTCSCTASCKLMPRWLSPASAADLPGTPA